MTSMCLVFGWRPLISIAKIWVWHSQIHTCSEFWIFFTVSMLSFVHLIVSTQTNPYVQATSLQLCSLDLIDFGTSSHWNTFPTKYWQRRDCVLQQPFFIQILQWCFNLYIRANIFEQCTQFKDVDRDLSLWWRSLSCWLWLLGRLLNWNDFLLWIIKWPDKLFFLMNDLPHLLPVCMFTVVTSSVKNDKCSHERIYLRTSQQMVMSEVSCNI